jgi:hypothetical protein
MSQRTYKAGKQENEFKKDKGQSKPKPKMNPFNKSKDRI